MNGLGRKNENKEQKQSIFTRETFGVVLILFATLSLICLITNEALFSTPGGYVSAFLFGCFGFFAYAVVIYAILMGVLLVTDKKINISKKQKTLITIGFTLIAFLAHVISMAGDNYTYGEYLSVSYQKGAGGISNVSGGGLFVGVVAYLLSALLTNVGCYVLLSVAIAIVGYFLIIDYIKNNSTTKGEGTSKFKSSYVKEDELSEMGIQIDGVADYPISDVNFTERPVQKLFVSNPEDFGVKSKREIAKDTGAGIKLDISNSGITVANSADSYVKAYGDELKKKIEYVKTPATIDVEKTVKNDYYKSSTYGTGTTVSDYVKERGEEAEEAFTEEIPFFEHEGSSVSTDDSAESHAEKFASGYADIREVEETAIPVEPVENFYPFSAEQQTEVDNRNEFSGREEIFRPFAEEKNEQESHDEQTVVQNEPTVEFKSEFEVETEVDEQPPVSSIIRERHSLFSEKVEENIKESADVGEQAVNDTLSENLGTRRSRLFDFQAESFDEPERNVAVEQEKPKKPAPPINREYKRPPFDLLENHAQPINAGQENHEERKEIIQRTLEEFHINAIPQGHIQGPSITRYEIMMPAGVSVKKVLSYDDDLKMRLSAKDGVRIEAPIPGKNLVGIEVANTVKTMVGFREVMEGLAQNPKKGSLLFAIGKDIVGNSISYDLSKGPHYLIAGATGSGKSVCLHVMLVSLLMRYSPEELKLVLVDPKSVEFRKYENLPHLLVDEIITEPKRVLTLLQWAYEETNRRNDMFTACGGEISNIDDYNSIIASDTVPKLPRIVFFIDELADLMENCKKDLEARIRMIAAKSRSAGIHLVLATQRPSVDVITGTIKANLPSRIALKVTNFTDSQIILNENGAEKLLGNGDMLYKDLSMSNYERYQGAYISGREITNVVNYIKENNPAYYDEEVQEFLDRETKPKQDEPASESSYDGGQNNENDALFKNALWLAVNSGNVSISALQRRFRVGYARAGAMVDDMERMGFISANEGSKARRVLLTKEEFINRFGPVEDDGY